MLCLWVSIIIIKGSAKCIQLLDAGAVKTILIARFGFAE
jgi:hypothetical protein